MMTHEKNNVHYTAYDDSLHSLRDGHLRKGGVLLLETLEHVLLRRQS